MGLGHIERVGVVFFLMGVLTGCSCLHPAPRAASGQAASIALLPRAGAFDAREVPQGAVGFTAAVRNDGPTALVIAHPSVCFPADYRQGETRRFDEAYGKSEILLKITRPDGAGIVLRDGSLHHFDPGNVPLLTIPPNGTGTFDVGWFFPNARGRWEQDDEAARVFLLKGGYRIRLLFRNAFPRAALYDATTGKTTFIDVWTGEMESAEIMIEVR